MAAVVAPATAAPPPTVIPPPPAADITSVATHETDTPRQGGQHYNGQPDLDPANQTLREIQHRTLFDFHIRQNISATSPLLWGVFPMSKRTMSGGS
jgi:hypothetical protein